MDGIILLGFIVAGLAFLGILAARFGVDSRDGSDDPRLPIRDIG